MSKNIFDKLSEFYFDRTKVICDCWSCQTSRRIKEICAKLPPEDAEWLDNLYNYFFELEAEVEMQKAYDQECGKIQK